eukprot:scaffold109867_cov14-Tisochrysis_lutea.AAC.2
MNRQRHKQQAFSSMARALACTTHAQAESEHKHVLAQLLTAGEQLHGMPDKGQVLKLSGKPSFFMMAFGTCTGVTHCHHGVTCLCSTSTIDVLHPHNRNN